MSELVNVAVGHPIDFGSDMELIRKRDEYDLRIVVVVEPGFAAGMDDDELICIVSKLVKADYTKRSHILIGDFVISDKRCVGMVVKRCKSQLKELGLPCVEFKLEHQDDYVLGITELVGRHFSHIVDVERIDALRAMGMDNISAIGISVHEGSKRIRN